MRTGNWPSDVEYAILAECWSGLLLAGNYKGLEHFSVEKLDKVF